MESLELAVETTKQLITLSSAIITIAFTFLKNFDHDVGGRRALLNLAVAAHFLATVFGIWTLMAITGGVASAREGVGVDIFSTPIAYPALLQVILFLAGMMMMMVSFIRTRKH